MKKATTRRRANYKMFILKVRSQLDTMNFGSNRQSGVPQNLKFQLSQRILEDYADGLTVDQSAKRRYKKLLEAVINDKAA